MPAIEAVKKLGLYLLIAAVLALSSCENSSEHSNASESHFRQYLDKISLLTATHFDDITIDYGSLAPPKRRSIRINNNLGSINFREFFSLSNCQINRLLGEHNSILNRHQDAVETLFYEIEFQSLAAECLANNTGDIDTIHLRLEAITEYKASNLNISLFNALFASKEMQKFLSPYGKVTQRTHEDELKELEHALRYFTRFTEQALKANSETLKALVKQRSEFDIALGQLRHSRFAGSLLTGLTLQQSYLGAANEALAAFQLVAKPCEHSDLISDMSADFEEYLAAALEKSKRDVTHLSSLNKILHALRPASRRIENAYWNRHWDTASEDSTLARFHKAEDLHRNLLKGLRSPCKN